MNICSENKISERRHLSSQRVESSTGFFGGSLFFYRARMTQKKWMYTDTEVKKMKAIQIDQSKNIQRFFNTVAYAVERASFRVETFIFFKLIIVQPCFPQLPGIGKITAA